MNIFAIIPARYDSTRFPGKPLFVIDGKSMIQRVYEQVAGCPEVNRVVVATDHQGILNHVHDFGGEAVMTASTHRSGTDRCAEALSILRRERQTEVDLVVNVQGDEPFIFPQQVSELIACFSDPEITIATLARRIRNPDDITDPNVVKLVFDLNHRVLYFSRAPIPFDRREKGAEIPLPEEEKSLSYFEHVGIYGFRADLLPGLVQLSESSLETTESLEQLRWLQNGYRIFVRETEYESISIDTPADVLKISGRNR